MTRIVAGMARGRRIAAPPGSGTRPTSDRVREALFSAIDAAREGLAGARVLDLYAGSGAVGLEALSRGAAAALLVEGDPRAARVVRANVAALGFQATARVVVDRAERVAARSCDEAPYDVAFLDPPYAVTSDELARVLTALRTNGWFTPGALVVVERATRDSSFGWPAEFVADRSRAYGETSLWYGHAGPGS